MRTSRFAVEQIAQALKRVEGGVVVGEVCRELGAGALPGEPAPRVLLAAGPTPS